MHGRPGAKLPARRQCMVEIEDSARSYCGGMFLGNDLAR